MNNTHIMGPTTLNHGESQCVNCKATNREIDLALGPVCPNAPTVPVMTDLAKTLADLAAKATPGPWEIDSEYDDDAHYSGGGGCGRGFKNFFIGVPVDGKWRTLLDSANSDHKLVEDGRSAWDSIGLANTSLTIELVNNLPAIIAALTAQAEHDKVLVERDGLEAENARLREALATFTRCAYPVDTTINARGYNWMPKKDLDYALTVARAALEPKP